MMESNSMPGDGFITLAQIKQEVQDALGLLDFAVESGFTHPEGKELSAEWIATIKTTAAKLGIEGVLVLKKTDQGETVALSAPGALTTEEWIAFEQAYYKLAGLLSPVTAQSLQDTDTDAIRGTWLFGWLPIQAPAIRFSRLLWLITTLFALVVIFGEWGLKLLDPIQPGLTDSDMNSFMQLVEILVPYAYGGLGSCVFLLRTAHVRIYDRSFDVRRKPEYFNRIILGTIAGGAINLFIKHISTDSGGSVELSAAALGFLAGYSNDFLFQTIERLIGALLPKVGIQSMRQAGDASSNVTLKDPDATLKSLMEELKNATSDEEKALYRSLIEKIRDKL